MGLFDIFKKKDNKESKVNDSLNYSLTDFEFYYLYGLTNNPFSQSTDVKSFNVLFGKVIGDRGGIIIGSSFHPYQIVNPKGTTVWHAAYVQLYLNEKKEEAFKAISQDNGQFLVNPSNSFKEIMVWPDTRLTNDENPIFSKYVPFIIPFLVFKSKSKIQWDVDLAKDIQLNGHSSNYVNSVSDMTRFLMPEPSFILGFDEFDGQNPTKLIQNFIDCKKLIE
jgi:hypothetical protein